MTTMKETIKIKDFLVVKTAALEIKKINILIGRQANGKSVVAKLVYFFRKMSTHFYDSIRDGESKTQLDKRILESFEQRFPRYAWDGTEFKVDYFIDGLDISVSGKKKANGKTKLILTYSDELKKIFNSKKKAYAKRIDDISKEESSRRRMVNAPHQAMYECVVEPLKKGQYGRFFASSVFIPASRSFFANLQKNIFTFMASNLDIDPFLKDFGSLYEYSKRWYRDSVFPRRPKDLSAALDRSIEKIIDGKYEFADDQDWINTRGRRVNLVNASSGQQESLPMLLTLAVWPFVRADDIGNMFFIEEPEAHLFPTAQSRIVSMLSAITSNLDVGFFVTTHSPYVLSALNNNILAGDVKEQGKLTDEEYQKISGDGFPLKFEDVAAYTITGGETIDILDKEFRMIGAQVIDEVSDHFQDVMNNLLERMEAR